VSLKDDRKGVWGSRILVVRERRIRALEALQKEAAVHRPYRRVRVKVVICRYSTWSVLHVINARMCSVIER
jgi:hypothetical protein